MCAETAYLSANALSSLPPSSVPSISPFLTRRRRLLRLLPKDHFVMSAALSHIFLGLARPKGAALALLLLLERRMSASQKPLLNVFCFPLSGKNNHRRSSSNGDKTLRPGPYIRYRVSRVWCHSGSEGGEVIDSRAAPPQTIKIMNCQLTITRSAGEREDRRPNCLSGDGRVVAFPVCESGAKSESERARELVVKRFPSRFFVNAMLARSLSLES